MRSVGAFRRTGPAKAACVVAGRQQLHCFSGGTEHLTPHASRFGSVSLEAGGRRIEVLPGWPQGANACGFSCGTMPGSPG